MKPFKARIQESLIVGLLTLAPLVITLWLLWSAVSFLDGAFYTLVPGYNNSTELFGIPVPGAGIVATFLLLLGAGATAKTFLGKSFQSLSDSFLSHLPLVRGLYKMTKQISSVFFSSSPTAAFKRVVYVPFPSGDARTLAFLASEDGPDHSFVYVPTAPNPTSGYVVRYPNTHLDNCPMSVDEALQLVLSCGAAVAAHKED
jgi:uncharacterized membrane protein